MDATSINSLLKSQLHSRMINYDLFVFEADAVAVIIKIRSTKVAVQLPYIITATKSNIVISSPNRSWELNSSEMSKAVQLIVRDMRKEEVKLSKFVK